MLPGKPTLQLRDRGPGASVAGRLWLVAESGGAYLLKGGQTGNGLRVWIEDEEIGKPGGAKVERQSSRMSNQYMTWRDTLNKCAYVGGKKRPIQGPAVTMTLSAE